MFREDVLLKISVVTPTLNRLNYLRECVESVLEQDYEPLEHVIVDGASTDGTVKYLESLHARYGDRIRWVSQPDSGISEAVNRGLRMARGDAINWIGSDDRMAPGAARTVAEYFLRHPEVLWLYGSYAEIDEAGRTRRLKKAPPYDRVRFLQTGYLCGPSVYVRMDLAKRAGLIREDLRYAMDYEWLLRMSEIAAPHSIEDVLAYFRWHSGCVTKTQRSAQIDEGSRVALRFARSRGERFLIAMAVLQNRCKSWLKPLFWDRFFHPAG
jgi:glycosyltransferase involved in cell wall biosynthesis